MEIKNIIESVITRFCHDLIGPIGTAAMALESGEMEILANTIEQTTLKLEIFRSIFRNNINKATAFNLLKKYIEYNNLNFQLKDINENLFALIFFITQKMVKKSSVIIENEIIQLNYFFFSDEEIATLENKAVNINSATVLPYLALLQYKDLYKINFIHCEEKNWQIKITKN